MATPIWKLESGKRTKPELEDVVGTIENMSRFYEVHGALLDELWRVYLQVRGQGSLYGVQSTKAKQIFQKNIADVILSLLMTIGEFPEFTEDVEDKSEQNPLGYFTWRLPVLLGLCEPGKQETVSDLNRKLVGDFQSWLAERGGRYITPWGDIMYTAESGLQVSWKCYQGEN